MRPAFLEARGGRKDFGGMAVRGGMGQQEMA